MKIINCNGQEPRYQETEISPTLCAACGTGGGNIPLIVMDKVNVIAGLGEKKSNGGTQHYQQDRIYDTEGISPSLMKDKSDLLIQVGQLYGTDTEPNPQAGRVYDQEGISPSLDTCQGGNRMPKITAEQGYKEGMRIRRLTPRECGRLQAFPDDYIDRAIEVCSDSQLYKQFGNSVTVSVIYEIAKRLK